MEGERRVVLRGGSNTCLPRQRFGGRHVLLPPQGPVCTLWRAPPTFPPLPPIDVSSPLLSSPLLHSPSLPPPIPVARPIRVEERASPSSRAGKGAHGKAHEGMPPLPFPSLPLCPRYPVRAERRRTRARRLLAFGPTPSPLAAHSHRRGAYEGTPPPPSPLSPQPLPSHEGAHDDTTPPAPPLPLWPRRPGTCRKGAREGTPPPAPPFPIRAEGGMEAREGTPPGPHPSPFTRKGVHEGTRPPIPIAPGPSPLGHPARTRGHGAPERTRVHEGTTSPAAPGRTEWMLPRTRRTGARRPRPPLPLVRAAPFARKGGMRGLAAPSRGAPFAWEWAHEAKTRGLRAPAFTAPAPRLRGIRNYRSRAWEVFPDVPPVRVTLFARKGGARGHAIPSPSLMCPIRVRRTITPPPLLPVAPGPPLPSCPCRPFAQKVHTRTGRRPLSLSPRPPFAFAWKECTQGHAAPGPTPFPLADPPCSGARGHAAPGTLSPLAAREGGMQGHAIPGPILPHSRGRVGARRHAALFAREGAHKAKQGQRGLRAPAFTAPAPRFRAP
ncbi:hypothetical protein EDB85DRAFT_2213975 [Lactarius pseudohatsudake]|nr:hypothetical protein EDB85DRAFT_2213975 [Lactarius pseudohatsudake]